MSQTDRQIFAAASLVGQLVHVTLTSGKVVEGVFHSCTGGSSHLSGSSKNGVPSFRVHLVHARVVAWRNNLSGPVTAHYVIDGTDFVSLEGKGVPRAFSTAGSKNTTAATVTGSSVTSSRGGSFRTDIEISGASSALLSARGGKILIPWNADSAGDNNCGGGSLNRQITAPPTSVETGQVSPTLDVLLLDDDHQGNVGEIWDQFAANEDKFGVKLQYDEDMYTTKLLDVPLAVRERAERIANDMEREKGSNAEEVEGVLEKDEEAQFSAVLRASVAAASRKAQLGITVASANNSEMKGINALNLEPALPKLDETTRNEWILFKQGAKSSSGGCHASRKTEKMSFKSSLQEISRRLEKTTKGEAYHNRNDETTTSILVVPSAAGPVVNNNNNSSTNNNHPTLLSPLLNRTLSEMRTSSIIAPPNGLALPSPAITHSVAGDPIQRFERSTFKFNPNADAFTPTTRLQYHASQFPAAKTSLTSSSSNVNNNSSGAILASNNIQAMEQQSLTQGSFVPPIMQAPVHLCHVVENSQPPDKYTSLLEDRSMSQPSPMRVAIESTLERCRNSASIGESTVPPSWPVNRELSWKNVLGVIPPITPATGTGPPFLGSVVNPSSLMIFQHPNFFRQIPSMQHLPEGGGVTVGPPPHQHRHHHHHHHSRGGGNVVGGTSALIQPPPQHMMHQRLFNAHGGVGSAMAPPPSASSSSNHFQFAATSITQNPPE